MKMKISKKVREMSRRVVAACMVAFMIVNAAPVMPVAADDESGVFQFSEEELSLQYDQEYDLADKLTVRLTDFSEEENWELLNKVSYESFDSSIVQVVSGSAIKATGAGTTQVKATLQASHNHSELEAVCTIHVIGITEQVGFGFAEATKEMTYGEAFEYPATGGSGSGIITYTSGNEEIATVVSGGAITAKKAGTVTITATKVGTGQYKDASATYELTINKATPDFLKFAVDGEEVTEVEIVAGQNKTVIIDLSQYADADGSISYRIGYEGNGENASDYAGIDANGTVTAKKCTPEELNSENGLYIYADYSGSEKYKDVTVKCKVTITPAALEGFGFENQGPVEVEYGKEYTNPLVGAGEDAEITYESNDETVATVDENGKVTAVGIGDATITATRKTDGVYAEATCQYQVKVIKARQEIAFPQAEYELYYGTNFEQAPTASLVEGSPNCEETFVTYAITEGEDIATIDSATGALTFNENKTGMIVVTATKAGNEKYEEATATYTLLVSYKVPEEGAYKVVDEKGNENADWYSGVISIVGGEDPEGNKYLLSRTNGKDEANWSEKLENVLENDGEGTVTFYVKSPDGSISDAITVNLKKDSVAPTGGITVDGLLDPGISDAFFVGSASENELTVNITSGDDRAGVKKIEYVFRNGSMTTEELDQVSDWTVKTDAAITIPKNSRVIVYAKITDEAGNYAYVNTIPVIFDGSEPKITIAPETDGLNGYYNTDVTLHVDVLDGYEGVISSGMKGITYSVVCGEEETQSGTLYVFDIENVTENDLCKELKDMQIIVEAAKNNADNIKVIVTAEDIAGNEKSETYTLNIDTTKPVVEVVFDEDVAANEGYYGNARKATVTITERDSSFKKTSPLDGFHIVAKDAAGNEIDLPVSMFGTWSTVEGDTPDEDKHSIDILFDTDANYELNFSYTDAAGNECEEAYATSFTVDREKPQVVIELLGSEWTGLATTDRIGNWSNEAFNIMLSATDNTSPIKSMEYYLAKETSVLSQEQLDERDAWETYNEEQGIAVENPGIYMLYVKITDFSGNYVYASTEGIVFENAESEVTLIPEGTNVNGIYCSDVVVAVEVKEIVDQEDEQAFTAGIKKIEYQVLSDNKVTQSKILFNFGQERPTNEQVVNEWTGNITVLAEENDSDNVVVRVIVTDNAGNITTKELPLRIAHAHPVLTVTYDNNSSVSEKYYNKGRIATISIKERTSLFDATEATNGVSVSAKDARGNVITIPAEKLSSWTTVEGDTPNETVHSATFSFNIDANYVFDFTYKNAVEYSIEKDYHTEFTVDTTAPESASIRINDKQWSSLATEMAGTIPSADSFVISMDATDKISPVRIEYFKINTASPMTIAELDRITTWEAYSPFSIVTDEAFVIFAKISDMAGNYYYINSQRHVLDKGFPSVVLTSDVEEQVVTNQDAVINVEISDGLPSSGIQLAQYKIVSDGIQTETGIIYSYGKTEPDHEIENTYLASIPVSARQNNSSNVEVEVEVRDFAGNVSKSSYRLNFDMSEPEITISFDNNNCNTVFDAIGYYAKPRTAHITIAERQDNFVEPVLGKDIQITCVDANGQSIPLETAVLIGPWTQGGETGGKETIYSADIRFIKDGEYKFTFSCQDIAGNVSRKVNFAGSQTPSHFIIDQEAPTAVLKAEGYGQWQDLKSAGNGVITNKDVVFTYTATDNFSTVTDALYYIAEGKTDVLSETQLATIENWTKLDKLSVGSDQEFVLYAKVADQAGNVTYVRSGKFIIDKTEVIVTALKPEEEARNSVYNDDVVMKVAVIDPIEGRTYSGIGKVTYEVRNMGTVTQNGVLFEEKAQANSAIIRREWSGEIVVDKALNNSNDVEIELFVFDNAGNTVNELTKIMLDATNPRISVHYDNNVGVINEENVYFFRQARTAEIAIYERNFDPDDVRLSIVNEFGPVPSISEWVTTEGTGNGDDNVHRAKVVFDADGEYTFWISFTDMAGNAADSEYDYGESVAPNMFVVDCTKPEITVSYDNNEKKNGMYYAKERNATIVVHENNFDPNEVDILVGKDGQVQKAAVVWNSNNGFHETSLRFSEDAVYSLDVLCSDISGNEANDFRREEFCIDTVSPKVTVTGITDNSANAMNEPIGFTVRAIDVNLDVFDMELSTFAGTEKKVVSGTVNDVTDGKEFTVYDITEDGIYKLLGDITDKAGNKYSYVSLRDMDNVPYDKEIANEDILTFSVNRNGSAFQINEQTIELIKQYYLKNVGQDIVIEEINVDNLEEYAVYVNGEKLQENVDFSVVRDETVNAWSKYTYTISSSLFEQEGKYSIVIGSVDKAQSSAYSDIKNNEVTFTVDRTPPVFTVSGLKNGGRYQVEKQIISIIPQDDGGMVSRLSVVITDEDGDVIKSYEWKDEELHEILEKNSNTVTAEIPTGLNMNVLISCSDGAYDEEGVSNTHEEVFNNVTVSNEWNVIFFANKPLFYGSLGGGALAIALGTGAIVMKRRKKKLRKA